MSKPLSLNWSRVQAHCARRCCNLGLFTLSVCAHFQVLDSSVHVCLYSTTCKVSRNGHYTCCQTQSFSQQLNDSLLLLPWTARTGRTVRTTSPSNQLNAATPWNNEALSSKPP
jgi:hypothetical protein